MKKSALSTRVCRDKNLPYVETRARVISSPDGSLPGGKVLVMKTPIFPPDFATDEQIRAATTTEIVEDERPGDLLCQDECGCETGGWVGNWQPWPPPRRKRSQPPGRNAPCPCGSGIKFKKCCLSEGNATKGHQSSQVRRDLHALERPDTGSRGNCSSPYYASGGSGSRCSFEP
jgi:hypothetical protein